jgi:hypothetical protein
MCGVYEKIEKHVIAFSSSISDVAVAVWSKVQTDLKAAKVPGPV